MATNKTINPTNQTVSIPAFTDQPDIRVITNDIDKTIDGVNTNYTAINNVQDGLAIVANGNTHAAITSGQFVYVKNHSTLNDGLYVASANIAANATLSSSNLTADAKGGLNALADHIGSIGQTGTKVPWIRALSEKTIAGNTTTEITVSNGTKALLMILSTAIESQAILFVDATGGGEVRIFEIKKGSNMSFDVATANKLKITVSVASTSYAYAIIFDGSGMS